MASRRHPAGPLEISTAKAAAWAQSSTDSSCAVQRGAMGFAGQRRQIRRRYDSGDALLHAQSTRDQWIREMTGDLHGRGLLVCDCGEKSRERFAEMMLVQAQEACNLSRNGSKTLTNVMALRADNVQRHDRETAAQLGCRRVRTFYHLSDQTQPELHARNTNTNTRTAKEVLGLLRGVM
ncbi:hypothetical protein PYCCODRAFT_524963 [Trametes coccinea BRFM310]|uniref:Uncharacterized protein n=1 Tax=Trametes coccinea (strain BRFM310) TaxID=1353009 RepID=A0A1Y2ILL5_TRAC3|nr:hypothetical protein PYCCODRAFT_524963 [Trametes coccinea BRFM310]